MELSKHRPYPNEIAEQVQTAENRDLSRLLPRSQLLREASRFSAAYPRVTSFEQLFFLLQKSKPSSITQSDSNVLMEELKKTDFPPLYHEAHVGAKRRESACYMLQDNMKNKADFSLLLIQIGGRLTQENVKTLSYLLQDLLTRYKAASLRDGAEILSLVQQRNIINAYQPDFLLTLLKDINRDDLCFKVEQYKMSCIMELGIINQENCTCCDECTCNKRNAIDDCSSSSWIKREYCFRLVMKKVADQLCPEDLENMKFLCQGIIPRRDLEKVENLLDLFWLLEDNGKLSIDNFYFLEELLENKQHLLEDLYHFNQENLLKSKVKNTCKAKAKIAESKRYKKTLKCIGLGLAQKEIKNLKMLHPDTLPINDEIKTGSQLMSLWQKHQLVTPTNLDLLRKALYAIGREDLCRQISMYFADMESTQQQCTTSDVQGMRDYIILCFILIWCTIDTDHFDYRELTTSFANIVESDNSSCKQCTFSQNYSGSEPQSQDNLPKLDLEEERNEFETKYKEKKVDQLRTEVYELKSRLHQVIQSYKMLEHQNDYLQSYNDKLVRTNIALHRQIYAQTTCSYTLV